MDPWKDAGEAEIPADETFTDDVRVLQFEDGMRISYDRTYPQDEEICRERVVETHHYKVCLLLKQQEYVPAESSFLWKFLMLESYNGQVDCVIDSIYADCDTEVFPVFGGGENFCRSGVLNGDKALLCEDDWAVVVNGEEEESKSVCRVHIGTGTGRCLGAPKTRTVTDDGGDEVEELVPAEELILEMQQSSWQGYHSEHINSEQVLEGEDLAADVVIKLPTDAQLDYQSLDESICTVDNDDSDGSLGTISILSGNAPDVCEVLLTISAPDFVDRVILAKIAVVQANDTAWIGYLSNPVFYVGEKRTPQAPTSTPASVALVYRTQDESICTVDESTGEVTGVASGECVVILNSSQDDYLEIEIESAPLSVTPAQSFTDFTWASFPSSGTVGVDINLSSNLPISQPAADTYEISIVSGDCVWNDSNKTLSFQNTSVCTVRAVAHKRGYEPETLELAITPVLGTLAITWNPATAGAVGVELLLDAVTGAPASAVIAYAVKNAGTTGCSFKGSSGADVRTLVFTGTGVCTVTASVSLTGYNPWTSSDVEVNVSAGALGNISWGRFTGTLKVGGARKIPSSASGTGLSGATVSYTLKAGSQANCTLTDANTGEVEAKVVDLTTTKTCTIVGTAARTGYAPATREISIDLSPGTMGTLNGPAYAGNLAVMGTLNISTPPSGAPSGASWSYTIAGERSGGVQNGICTIDEGTGKVSATSAAVAGDFCIVTAQASTIGYTAKNAPVVRLEVSAQEALTITWSGYSPASLAWASGGVNAPTLNTVSVTDTDSNVVDGGISRTYSLGDATTNSACTVNSSTGALTINGAGTCEIILTVADIDSTNEESYATQSKKVTVIINKGAQTIAVSANPYGASPALNVGDGDLPVANAPTGGQTSLALEYQSLDTDVCTVISSSGTVSPITSGTCTVPSAPSGQ